MVAAIDTAVAAIKKSGAMRTPALAELLGIGEVAVDAMLGGACERGFLVSCAVTLGAGRQVQEYRISTAGGGGNVVFTSMTVTKRNSFPSKVETTYGSDPAAGTSQGLKEFNKNVAVAPLPIPAADKPKEGTPVATALDRIKEALKAHGAPMKLAALAKASGVDVKNVSPIVSVETKKGTFKKFKHGVYGLPDQKLEESEGAPQPGKGGGKRKGPAVRRKPARKAASKAASKRSRFQPAITADGTILLLGTTKGDFDITRAEAKVFVTIARLLNPLEVGALAAFITRLDAGKVGA